MIQIQIKYGNSEIPYEIPEKNLSQIVRAKSEPKGVDNPRKTIENAIQKPICSPKLSKLVKSGSKIVITQDDPTRGTPGFYILPPLLNTLNACGVPDENIMVLFACGTHRPVNIEEQKTLVGSEVLERVTCLNHDCDAPDLVNLGLTSREVPIELNALAAKADCIIATGRCEYHYYAGFSGGSKSILAGICSRTTINKNHAFMIDERAITGNLLHNPIYEDMVEAAQMTATRFLVNIVQNTSKQLIRAFAGDLIRAHLAAVKFYDSLYRVKVKGLADIVLVGVGYPRDINLYQGHKAIDNAQQIVRPGGVIVCALECSEGVGNSVFYDWAKKYHTYKELETQIKMNFEMGGHKAYYIAKVLQKAHIILISKMNPKEIKEVFGMKPAKTVEEAMDLAYSWVGHDAKVAFMPDGTITLPFITGPK